MQSIMKVLFLLGLMALVSAGPMVQKRGVYKVERVPNPSYTGRNGPRSLLKTLRKYRMPVPASLVAAVAKSDVEMVTRRQIAGLSMPVPVDHLDGVDAVEVEMVQRRKDKKGKKAAAAAAAADEAGAAAEPAAKKGAKGAAAGTAAGAATGAAAGAAAGAATGKKGAKGVAGGKNSTAPVTQVASGNGTGLVTATPEANDVEYLSPVDIGGQTLNLDFDSGSSDLWVFSSQLSAAATKGHTVYDNTKSKTFTPLQGGTFQISYGDGSGAAGNVGFDTVSLGGAVVQKQAVELATAVSTSFVQDTNNNGLLGLAFSKLNTVKPQQQKTFFDNVMPSLAEPVFTADLRAQAVGAYEFGRIDSTKFTGAMAWVPVNASQGFWQFTSEKFAVGTGAAQASTAGGQAIADTGTTLILADPKVTTAYYAQVPGAVNDAASGGFVFPCATQMPDLMLDVGGNMAKVKGADINFAKVNATTCFGGVQASPANLAIYGDIFFKSQFVAFNGGNMSLGVAQHV